ncbi:single-stranded DNA-binding protein [Verrucomicrobiales bacterium]|jgi:spoIIIJ-associated protein|nr:single-stranded DNA-binding protein [Verrucomicrobiales bacterium]MDB4358818.1 single-stranded DNA-binding protein [Verrucomicrobiales bacterium]
MDHFDTAQEILDTMLGHLGFAAKVDLDRESGTLNVTCAESKLLIGHNGSRLDEIQYLLNRVLQDRIPEAPKVKVDIESFIASRDYGLIEDAESAAAGVIASGTPAKLEPMNSYQRRLVHHHFADHPEIKTWSPGDSARLKRMTISSKNAPQTSPEG